MPMSRADDGAPEPTAENEPRESWSTPVSDLRSDGRQRLRAESAGRGTTHPLRLSMKSFGRAFGAQCEATLYRTLPPGTRSEFGARRAIWKHEEPHVGTTPSGTSATSRDRLGMAAFGPEEGARLLLTVPIYEFTA